MISAQEQWQQLYRFPVAIGAVDCTHVQIEKPKRHVDEYLRM